MICLIIQLGLHDYQIPDTDIPRNEFHLIVFDEKSGPENY